MCTCLHSFARSQVAEVQAAPAQVENQLNKESPFVCKIKFQNNLPELPCDPKMLTAPLDTDALSRFHLTQMELALRPDIISDMDPCSLSLIDMQQYCVDPEAGELDPEDRAIIEGNKGSKARSSVTWLMKTRCACQALAGSRPLTRLCVLHKHSSNVPCGYECQHLQQRLHPVPWRNAAQPSQQCSLHEAPGCTCNAHDAAAGPQHITCTRLCRHHDFAHDCAGICRLPARPPRRAARAPSWRGPSSPGPRRCARSRHPSKRRGSRRSTPQSRI